MMLSDSIELTHDGTEVVFTTSELEEAFRSETIQQSPALIVNSFDPEIINGLLEPVRGEFEDEPVDAEFVIEGDSISIVPGKKGPRSTPPRPRGGSRRPA